MPNLYQSNRLTLERYVWDKVICVRTESKTKPAAGLSMEITATASSLDEMKTRWQRPSGQDVSPNRLLRGASVTAIRLGGSERNGV